MTRQAVPCGCGMAGCRDWHVAPEAETHGVKFSRAQAEHVARVLDMLDGDSAPIAFSWIGHDGTASVIEIDGKRVRLKLPESVRAYVGHHLEDARRNRVERTRCSVRLECNAASIDPTRLEELERHGAMLRKASYGMWEVWSIATRLAVLDPRCNWVRKAIEQPEVPVENAIEALCQDDYQGATSVALAILALAEAPASEAAAQ